MQQPSRHPLDAYKIPNIPPSIYYLPNFLTPQEEQHFLSQINIKTWIELTHRRLQVYPAQLTSKNVLLSSTGLPEWLRQVLGEKFRALNVFNAVSWEGDGNVDWNHCLINNYRPGEGILGHEDGPAYWPVTVTVSLGGHTVLEVWSKDSETSAGDSEIDGVSEAKQRRKWRILQEPRSLLVTRDEAYSCTLHAIKEVERDEGLDEAGIANWGLLGEKKLYEEGWKRREERTSLTCRSVVKVSKLGSRLFGR